MSSSKQIKPINELTDIEKEKLQCEVEALVEKSELMLNSSVLGLLKAHGFIGHLIQMLIRIQTVDIPTAAVAAVNNRYNLLINPFFYGALDIKEAKAVLTHEIYHLLNNHLKRGRDLEPKLWNVAADLAINCYIDDLPRFDREQAKQKMITKYNMTEEEADKQLPAADKEGKCNTALMPSDYKLPNNRPAEWYYKAIMQDKDLSKKFGSQKTVYMNPGTGETNMTPEEQEQLKQDIKDGKVRFDYSNSHDEWDSINGHTKEILDDELRRMIQEAKDKDPESYGNLPGSMKQTINDFLSTRVGWRSQFRNWVQVATRVLRVNTRKRRSRRFGITYPGQKSDFKLNLGVYVDTSGSMTEEDLKLCGGEINKMFSTKLADIEIMAGDTTTHEHYPMKRIMKPSDFKISGYGGTDASAWIKYASKEEFDALIILTDGYFSYNIEKPKYPVLWVLTVSSCKIDEFKKSIPFGRVIKLEGENK